MARPQGLDPSTGPRLEHTYFLLEAAASGLGVAIGSVPLVKQDLQAGRLVAPYGFAGIYQLGSGGSPAR
jgi:DNA-binding transcriptional LysR family regulator